MEQYVSQFILWKCRCSACGRHDCISAISLGSRLCVERLHSDWRNMASAGLALNYFPLRARAECLRMIMHYGHIPFEDVVVPMDQWPGVKATGDLCPFGQLPSLKLPDGTIIAQTGAIARFLAKLSGIYPDDPVAAAKADMIFEFALELNMINPLVNFWLVQTDVWKSNHDLFFNALPSNLAAAERLLGDGPFFGGSSPHHGDFALFHVFDVCVLLRPDCLDGHPRLKAFAANVAALPAVRDYLLTRLPPAKVGMCGSFMQVAIAKAYHK